MLTGTLRYCHNNRLLLEPGVQNPKNPGFSVSAFGARQQQGKVDKSAEQTKRQGIEPIR